MSYRKWGRTTSVQQRCWRAGEEGVKRRRTKTKRAVIRAGCELRSSVGGHLICAMHALRPKLQGTDVRAFGTSRTACSLAADEAALILARFYMSPPAGPGGPTI